MASETSKVSPPAEPVQRRPMDFLWFAVLAASVATGIGMTIFAPVGDAPPPPPVDPAISTVPMPNDAPQPSTTPATAPTP